MDNFIKHLCYKPTACFPLIGCSKVVAALDILVSVLGSLLSIGSFIFFEYHHDAVLEYVDDPPPILAAFIDLRPLGVQVIRVFLTFNAFYWLFKILLAIELLVGIYRESIMLIRIWLFTTLLLLIFSVLFFLAAIVLGIAKPLSIPIYVAAFVIREYTFWMVGAIQKRFKFGKLPLIPISKKVAEFDEDPCEEVCKL